jgi:hypothetical protein
MVQLFESRITAFGRKRPDPWFWVRGQAGKTAFLCTTQDLVARATLFVEILLAETNHSPLSV